MKSDPGCRLRRKFLLNDLDFADAERGDCLTADRGGRMEAQNGLSNLDAGYVVGSRITIITRGNAK